MKKRVFESDVKGGEPIFPNTKVPISYLFAAMKVSGFIDNFIEIYPTVTKKQVIALFEAAEESLLTSKDAALIHKENEALSQSLRNVTQALLATIADGSNPKHRPKKARPPLNGRSTNNR